MERVAVESTDIASWGYNPITNEMEIEYRRSGAVYTYFRVPGGVADGFDQADSKGSFTARNIKGVYAFKRGE